MAIIHGYHGTNQKFDKFDQSKAKIINDYYGGGAAYFTPNINVARQYAKAAVRKTGGHEIIYRVQGNFQKIFDVDKEYTGKELLHLIGNNFEQFARSSGLLSLGSDRYGIMGDLKNGNMVMKGSDIFKGMSNGMVNTSKARQKLIHLKYDALRYNPVIHASRIHHEVYIAYDPKDIHILGIYGNDN